MTPIAILFFLIAAVLIWGGLATSILFLSARPQVEAYPPGAEDDLDGDE
ncbi:MetS family NSS transporter small subunit [Microbacterium oryzae]|nr:MetS family NSS transporter small subunit [Microbacterium oryzae]MDN3309720.1 MetS family NSS transporter small subunit [Microbacterium oryzae]